MKHLPSIFCNSITHKNQRYETCGDYLYENLPGYGKAQKFFISRTIRDYEFLIFIHELVEWYLTLKRGIKEKDITNFDLTFEKERIDGKWTYEEPGNDKRAPYRKEHIFATKIEKIVARELGVDWDEYDKTINEL